MIAALVPAKALHRGKSRLRASLGADAAEALAEAMLRDVLEALAAATHVDTVAVVTPDPLLADLARDCGALPLLGEDPGLNPSLLRGARELAAAGHDALLVVLGDVAGLQASDVDHLLESLDALGPRGVVLAPSRDGGSAALARRPVDLIPPRFGRDSAARHREEATEAGVPFREITLPSLEIDVDAAEDLRSLMGGAGVGRHTARVLQGISLE